MSDVERDPVLFRPKQTYNFNMPGVFSTTLSDGTCWIVENETGEPLDEDTIRRIGKCYYPRDQD